MFTASGTNTASHHSPVAVPPHSLPRARRRQRAVAVGAITALIVTGLVTMPAVAVIAAGPLPAGAVAFLASQSNTGVSGDTALTPDGQRVAFTSTASDLVTSDSNGLADVFISAVASGTTDPFAARATLISAPDASMPQVPANGPSSSPVVSANGRYIAFLSSATNLVAGASPTGGRVHAYWRDTETRTTVRLQLGADVPLGSARSVDMSDDGRTLVFVSDAANLSTGDENETWDGFIVRLAPQGSAGAMSVTRILPDRSVAFGVTEAVISGNGDRIAFHTLVPLDGSAAGTVADYLYQGSAAGGVLDALLLSRGGHDVSIDSAGNAMAFVSEITCDAKPTVIAATVDIGGVYWVAVGTRMVERRSGTVARPQISANSNMVVWETTQPAFSFAGQAPALPAPVTRVGVAVWTEATRGGPCEPIEDDWTDVAAGVDTSLSASGRTVAFSGASTAAAGATASAVVVDLHSHDGLAVSSIQGETLIPPHIAVVDISKLSVSSLRGYAAALANAPIHRLPIHRLPIHRLPIHRLPIHRLLIDDSPIHRLPIHRLPIHRLPIHRLDIPGGWAELLAATPFGGSLLQSVTLAEVLDWADATMANAGAPAAERAAATRIQSLSLDDVDLENTGIDGLSLASLLLGSAPLAEVEIVGTDTPTQRWQRVVTAQALGATVDATTLLADLDAAGLNIDRSGIESVPLHTLPVADTLLDTVDMNALFLPGTPLGVVEAASLTPEAQSALFGGAATGTLASHAGQFLDASTAADLAAGAPASTTFGDLLFSVLDADSYPWEDISPSAIDPQAAVRETSGFGCNGKIRCENLVQFTYTFDPGPGEPTTFLSPTATVTLPVGTTIGANGVVATGSGPEDAWHRQNLAGMAQLDGRLVRLPLANMPGGTSLSVNFWHSGTNTPGPTESVATLSSGGVTVSRKLQANSTLVDYDDDTNNWINGGWEDPVRQREALQEGRLYYEWISQVNPQNTGRGAPGPALDEDYFLINPPEPGQRLVVSTNASDGQIAMALFANETPGAPLGAAGVAPAPGTAVTEQGGGGASSAESGNDAAAPFAGHTLVDQASVGGDGVAELEAASMDAAPGQQMMLRVTSGNGLSSSSLYSLRVRYVDETPETVCLAWAPTQTADPGVVGASDPITAGTNTVYLYDSKRFGDTHGAAQAAQVRAALATMTGTGRVGADTVNGAVLSIDASPAVRAARTALDANPCSMSARTTLTTAINAYVTAQLGGERSHISSIVLIGGDDIVPLAPVAQHTAQFNEASHSADLRRETAPNGLACPTTVAEGAVDACATPLSAAAAGNFILSDDPYGLANAYRSLGGYLYVPSVGVGRLVETPRQIIDSTARFVASGGVLAADSTLAGGYGAWSELPALVTENLAWRSPNNPSLPAVWDKTVLENRLFGGPSARVVSINTHADETRIIPGIPNAEDQAVAESDMFTAKGHVPQASAPGEPPAASTLAGALIFMIGCHAGGNLPASYYGDVADWADVFAPAGGFVGNTGYGLANSISTALSERLLGLYANWIGVSSGGNRVSAAGALAYAKQSYLGGLGLYSGYDEKVLMEAVYYGLPMYTFTDTGTTKTAPVPQRPADLTQVHDVNGLLAASLSLAPTFRTVTAKDDSGRTVSYLTANAQDPLVIPGQPILPRVVSKLDPAPAGKVARGALITGLSSQQTSSATLMPAIANATIGVAEGSADRANVAFPSTFATITTQQSPTGPIDLLVTTPGRVESAADGTGTLEQFTTMNIDVVYGDAASTDTTAPTITSVILPAQFSKTFKVVADGTTTSVAKVLLLAQKVGETQWRPFPLSEQPQDLNGDGIPESQWVGNVDFDGAFRWIVQVVDASGNVATESARGHLDAAAATAPALSDSGDPATLHAGDRLLRSVSITDAATAGHLSGSFRIETPNGSVIGSGPMAIKTAPSETPGTPGATSAILDRIMDAPGTFVVVMNVCRGATCTSLSFDLTVAPNNTAPTATLSVAIDTGTVYPSSTLTATGVATDADAGDTPIVKYGWLINGTPAAASGPSLNLTPLALVPGDVVTAVATPNDGQVDGHAARTEFVVHAQPTPPAAPVIVAAARTAGTDYVAGAWSTAAVTVSFTCTSGVTVLNCPAAVTVSADTGSAGTTITRTMTDFLGRSASASILVRIDATVPKLSPTVTPSTVKVGAAVTAAPNASDTGSGIATSSCAAADTATPGSKTVECSAADAAGNQARATANYVVMPASCAGADDRTALAPLASDGSSVFLRTSGVPVVFRACDMRGNPINTKGFVKSVTLVATTALPANSKITELWYPPVTAFGFRPVARTWVGMISTAKLAAGKRYTYEVLLTDGTSFTLTFGVR